MYLQRLDLLAYGHFTGVSFDLHRGFNVVYGPNEAGKSTTLRALLQLLFGFDTRCSDNFRHSYDGLRVGAVLGDEQGETLECIRRKALKKSLRAADDSTEIPEERLARMLGRVDASTFAQQFGIDYERLVAGGRQLVKGEGDVAQSLFAAATGVANLGRVKDDINSQLEQLYKYRGQRPKLNELFSRLKSQRDEVKKKLLASTAWEDQDRALRDARRDAESIAAELRALAVEHSKCQRVRDALPLIGRREQLLAQLNELHDAPRLDGKFTERRRDAVNGRSTAERDLLQAKEKCDAILLRREQLSIDDQLLARAARVQQLVSDLGKYDQACRDRPGLDSKRQAVREAIEERLSDLGRSPDLANCEGLRLTETQRQRIRQLADERGKRVSDAQHRRQSLEKLRADQLRLEKQLESLPAASDVGELKRAVERIEKEGDLRRKLAAQRRKVDECRQRAETKLAQLALFSGTLEEFERLVVPSNAAVQRAEREFADSGERLKELRKERKRAESDLRTAQQQIDRMRAEQDVPTEDDLNLARARRRQVWELIRPDRAAANHSPTNNADSGGANTALVAELLRESGGADLCDAHERLVARSEELADRLRREAARVSELAQCVAAKARAEDELRRLEGEQADFDERKTQLQSEWRELWRESRLEPRTPEEMREWLAERKSLLEELAELAELNSESSRLRDEIVEHVAELERQLPSVSSHVSQEDPGGRLRELLDAAKQVVSQSEQHRIERRQVEGELKKVVDETAAAVRDVETANAKLDEWQTQWAECLTWLELPGDALPMAALAVADRMAEVLAKHRELQTLDERLEAIDRSCAEFAAMAQSLAAQVDGQLAERPVVELVDTLQARLNAAQAARTQRAELDKQLLDWQSRMETAEREQKRADAELEVLYSEAGATSVDALVECERRAALRRTLETELENTEQQLRRLAGRDSLDAWIDEARRIASDDLEPRIEDLGRQIEQLEQRRDEANQRSGQAQAELDRMDGAGAAAAMQDEVESTLAQIRTHAEQYTRLSLAAAVLDQAIARYREQNQGPVLKRASELFRQLTLGSFSGLEVETDGGQSKLVGRRAGAETRQVELSGMSEGTCDQLYLALRLATLEHHFTSHSPLPFIVDDILIKFDDDRAVAALRTLVDLSRITQVIFFTHHQHLVELAVKHLDHGSFVVRQLGMQAATND